MLEWKRQALGSAGIYLLSFVFVLVLSQVRPQSEWRNAGVAVIADPLIPVLLWALYRMGWVQSLLHTGPLVKLFELFKTTALLLLVVDAEAFHWVCATHVDLAGCIDDREYSSLIVIRHPVLDRDKFLQTYYTGCTKDQIALIDDECDPNIAGAVFIILLIFEIITTMVAFSHGADMENGVHVQKRRIQMINITRVMSLVWHAFFWMYEFHRRPAIIPSVISIIHVTYVLLGALFVMQMLPDKGVGVAGDEGAEEAVAVYYQLLMADSGHTGHKERLSVASREVTDLIRAVCSHEQLDVPPRCVEVLPAQDGSPLLDVVPEGVGGTPDGCLVVRVAAK